MFETGTLVWAKLRKFKAWPAIVSPNSGGKTEKMQARKSYTHVVFLEYGKQHAWVPTKNVKEFTGEKNDKRNVKSVKTAVDTAISMMEIDNDDRLTLMDIGRPVIRGEGATDMQHKEGRNDGEGVIDHENDEAVVVNNNGSKKAGEEKGAPNMLEGATNMQQEADGKRAQAEISTNMQGGTNDKNMQQEMDTNDMDDVYDNENVAVINGRKKATVEKRTNMRGGATNKKMQHEMDSNDMDDVSGHENTEAVGRDKARVGKRDYMPGGSTKTNRRQKSPPQAHTSKTGNQTCGCTFKRVKVSFEMEESTWLKTIEIAPKFLETVSKF